MRSGLEAVEKKLEKDGTYSSREQGEADWQLASETDLQDFHYTIFEHKWAGIQGLGSNYKRSGLEFYSIMIFGLQLEQHVLTCLFALDNLVFVSAPVLCDVNSISIGSGTNIQDHSLVHVAKSNLPGKVHPTVIGDNVTVGHSAILHGCTVEDEAFVGMKATLLDGVVVEKHAMVAAGALVRQDTRIPSGEHIASHLKIEAAKLKERVTKFIGVMKDRKIFLEDLINNSSGFGLEFVNFIVDLIYGEQLTIDDAATTITSPSE
ncbi:gamma carbonic anhydrase 1, mitochondrial, partial [Tanacetum coccineum]